ncbi:MAG: Hpt domain-containing protein [Flavobacteriales bacterium]|nr:Hpt domain-containing protein [Flavobacteriales bacterium]MCB9447784.1 Hpt domain-containing protein [Flavobacteriales bacterium]
MSLDVQKLKKYLDCDDAFVAKVIDHFISESRTIVRQIEKRLDDKDVEGIRSSAHKILSSTRIMGIDNISRLFEHIEIGAKKGRSIEELRPEIEEAAKAWQQTVQEMELIKDRLSQNPDA